VAGEEGSQRVGHRARVLDVQQVSGALASCAYVLKTEGDTVTVATDLVDLDVAAFAQHPPPSP
jgi:hypothetical protein